MNEIRNHAIAALLIGAVALLLTWIIYINERTWQQKHYRHSTALSLHDAALGIAEEYAMVTSDLLALSGRNLLADAEDPENPPHALLEFMKHKQLYDQLRVLDAEGVERLRINNNEGRPSAVLRNSLQDKSGRYYVQEAMRLGPEEVYLSRIDLNMEGGQIELPHKPVFRVATPLFEAGRLRGVLVLNVKFDRFLRPIHRLLPEGIDAVWIADRRGRWLVAPPQQEAWTFMRDENASNQLRAFNPELWEAIETRHADSMLLDEEIFAFERIRPLHSLQYSVLLEGAPLSPTLQARLASEALEWTMIAGVPESLMAQKAWTNVRKGLPYLAGGSVLLLAALFYFLRVYREKVRFTEELKLAASCFEHADDGMVITDPETKIINVNPRYERLTGYDKIELVGRSPKLLSSGWTDPKTYIEMWKAIRHSGFWEGELRDRQKNGTVYMQWLRIMAIRNAKGDIVNYLGICTDITEKKRNEEKIRKLAFEDTLTGLPNRQLFMDRLTQSIALAKRQNGSLALLFIDLDNFKLINDTSGHLVGDKYLIEIAHRLQGCLRVSDTLARLGGDEFVIILNECDEAFAGTMAERLITTLDRVITIDHHEFYASASIGIATCPADADEAHALIRFADTAMYNAKESGKNRYRFFRSEMNAQAMRRIELEKHLHYAIDRNELFLLYQPQISLETRAVVGAEALLRWQCESLGAVSPAEFIPLAEATGRIVPITLWILEAVCKDLDTLESLGLGHLRVGINISSLHVREERFVGQIHGIIARHGIDPSRIELEITEGALLGDIQDTVAKLEHLGRLGYHIAIDDFGTGYSSLSYLKRFRFDKLKIDQSFVRGLPDDTEDAGITRAVIAIADVLGMELIAEGAETSRNIEFLRRFHCQQVQGYYFSRPLPLEELIAFVETFRYPEEG